MRGGALCPAARLLWCLLVSAVSPLGAQAPVRTRDVGFATVDYSNGLTLGALTLTETLALERASGSLFATGLFSRLNDGRGSRLGWLTGWGGGWLPEGAPREPRGLQQACQGKAAKGRPAKRRPAKRRVVAGAGLEPATYGL